MSQHLKLEFFIFREFNHEDMDEQTVHVLDKVYNQERGFELVAKLHNITYLESRSIVLDYYKTQNTFSVYGVCSSALREGTYIYRKIVEYKNNRNAST